MINHQLSHWYFYLSQQSMCLAKFKQMKIICLQFHHLVLLRVKIHLCRTKLSQIRKNRILFHGSKWASHQPAYFLSKRTGNKRKCHKNAPNWQPARKFPSIVPRKVCSLGFSLSPSGVVIIKVSATFFHCLSLIAAAAPPTTHHTPH